MSKKRDFLDLNKKEALIDRQRRLWAHAEAIEIAQQREQALPAAVSEWLHRALKNIACGIDANEAFNVVPEQPGVRKDGFLREMQRKISNGYVAAGTDPSQDVSTLKKTSTAIEEISQALPSTKKSTVRKNWNKLSTDRKPTFTIGKK
jgi:hypothetical protein